MTPLSYSYYHYRAAISGQSGLKGIGMTYMGPKRRSRSFFGFGATVHDPGAVQAKDPTTCAVQSPDCPSCYTCCNTNFHGVSLFKNTRCKTRCDEHFGKGVCSGTPGPTPTGGCKVDADCPQGKCSNGTCIACGIQCSGPGVNEPYDCNYKCGDVPITPWGGVLPTGSQALPSSPTALPVVGYDAFGQPIYAGQDTGITSILSSSPLLTLGLVAGAAYLFLKK